MMGGKLEVESTYGEGAEFFFTIEQKKAEEEKESRLNVPLPHFLQRRRVAHDEQQTDKKA